MNEIKKEYNKDLRLAEETLARIAKVLPKLRKIKNLDWGDVELVSLIAQSLKNAESYATEDLLGKEV